MLLIRCLSGVTRVLLWCYHSNTFSADSLFTIPLASNSDPSGSRWTWSLTFFGIRGSEILFKSITGQLKSCATRFITSLYLSTSLLYRLNPFFNRCSVELCVASSTGIVVIKMTVVTFDDASLTSRTILSRLIWYSCTVTAYHRSIESKSPPQLLRASVCLLMSCRPALRMSVSTSFHFSRSCRTKCKQSLELPPFCPVTLVEFGLPLRFFRSNMTPSLSNRPENCESLSRLSLPKQTHEEEISRGCACHHHHHHHHQGNEVERKTKATDYRFQTGIDDLRQQRRLQLLPLQIYAKSSCFCLFSEFSCCSSFFVGRSFGCELLRLHEARNCVAKSSKKAESPNTNCPRWNISSRNSLLCKDLRHDSRIR